MNLKDKNEVAAKDVELTSEYFNQCICTSFHSDSGAGVNASTSQDAFFGDADPLSELVLSPRQGLCVRCADGTGSKEKTYFNWCSEPTNNKLNSNAKMGTISKPVDQDGVVSPPFLYLAHCKEKAPLELSHTTRESGDHQVQEMKSYAGPSYPFDNDDLPSCSREDVQETENSCTNAVDYSEEDTKRLKRSYINLWDENVFVEGKKSTRPEESKGVKSDSRQVLVESRINWQEGMICGRRFSDIPEVSPSKLQKLKGKSIVDEEDEANKRYAWEEDESDESVESCSPADVVSTSKSKRHIQSLPDLSSYSRKASSFQMWVSNMFMGYPPQQNTDSVCDKSSKPSTFHSFFGIPCSPKKALQPSEEKPILCDFQAQKIESQTGISRRFEPTIERSLLLKYVTNPEPKVCDMVIETNRRSLDGDQKSKVVAPLEGKVEENRLVDRWNSLKVAKPVVHSYNRDACEPSYSNSGESPIDFIFSLCRPSLDVNMQCVPKHVFEGTRRLQISRADVRKWMQLEKPLSDFDGFFLRVRLSNVELGHRCNKYFVAKIVEGHRTFSVDEQVSFTVDIGPGYTTVEYRFISNKGFFEDELFTWWSLITLIGEEVPSAEKLRLKFDQKQRLGL